MEGHGVRIQYQQKSGAPDIVATRMLALSLVSERFLKRTSDGKLRRLSITLMIFF